MKSLLLTVLIALSSITVLADIRLPDVIGNSMVLQQKQTVPIWGSADPGETVIVTFAGQKGGTGCALPPPRSRQAPRAPVPSPAAAPRGALACCCGEEVRSAGAGGGGRRSCPRSKSPPRRYATCRPTGSQSVRNTSSR